MVARKDLCSTIKAVIIAMPVFGAAVCLHTRDQLLVFVSQAKGVKVVADYVAQLRRVSDGHGVWHFDRILQADAAKLNTPAINSIPA